MASDLHQNARTLIANQSILAPGIAKLTGASLSRMMLVNPRKLFKGADFDYVKLLSKISVQAVMEFALNVLGANYPGYDTIAAIAQAYIYDILKEHVSDSFFMFKVNPQTMKVNHQKIVNEQLTGAGWDFDVTGDQLSNYTFSGTTGNMLTGLHSLVPELFTIKLSRAFFKFVAFEQFYLYNNNDPLLIVLDNTGYVGKITNMSWNWEADDIYQIKYDFTFRVNPIMSFDLVSGMGITSLFDKADLTDLFTPNKLLLKDENSLLGQNTGIDVYETEAIKYRNI